MHSEDDTSNSDSDDEENQRRIERSNAFIAYESSDKSLETDAADDDSSDDEAVAFLSVQQTFAFVAHTIHRHRGKITKIGQDQARIITL